MAKKKRNNRKRHNRNEDAHNHDEFLADVPETDQEDWEQDESEAMELRNDNHDNDSIVDPYSEQLSDRAEGSNDNETIYEEEESFEEASESAQEMEHEFADQDLSEQRPAGFSLGAYLQGERERLGISLKNVSQSTKISITKLEHLEADDIDSLPDRAYVTGYVKSYAKLLGVELNFCLNLLDKTYEAQGALPREPEIVIPQAQNSPAISDGFPMAKIAAIAAMVIVIVGIGGFFLTRDKSAQPESVATTEPATSQETSSTEDESEEEITPQTLNAETPLQQELSEQTEEPVAEDDSAISQEKEEPVKQEAKVVQKVEEKKEEPKVTEVKKEDASENKKEDQEEKEVGENEEKRKFYPLANNLYTFDTEMDNQTINDLLPSQFRVSPVEGIQAIFITATKGDSWLTYKSDDDPIKKFVLKEGRSLLFRAKEARVFLGNLGAVRIFLNNRPLKVTSRTGVKSLVFPQENANNYVMPLFIYKEDGTVQTSEDWIKENE